MPQVVLKGESFHTIRDLPALGEPAPAATLVDKDLNDVELASLLGEPLLLNAVPSLDTPTCQVSTRRLNALALAHRSLRALVVSADLPFAQGRFLEQENLRNVMALSMMRDREFAIDYGLLLQDGPLRGINARALIAIDAAGILRHMQLVGDLSHEPDYDAALNALDLESV